MSVIILRRAAAAAHAHSSATVAAAAVAFPTAHATPAALARSLPWHSIRSAQTITCVDALQRSRAAASRAGAPAQDGEQAHEEHGAPWLRRRGQLGMMATSAAFFAALTSGGDSAHAAPAAGAGAGAGNGSSSGGPGVPAGPPATGGSSVPPSDTASMRASAQSPQLARSDAESRAVTLTVSSVTGVCAGYALKKVGRAAALAVGLGFLAYHVALRSGVIDTSIVTVNVREIEARLVRACDRDGDGVVSYADAATCVGDVARALGENMPSAAAFSAGFFIGLRYG